MVAVFSTLRVNVRSQLVSNFLTQAISIDTLNALIAVEIYLLIVLPLNFG